MSSGYGPKPIDAPFGWSLTAHSHDARKIIAAEYVAAYLLYIIDEVLWAMQTTHQTSHGQLMDLITAPIGTVRVSFCS